MEVGSSVCLGGLCYTQYRRRRSLRVSMASATREALAAWDTEEVKQPTERSAGMRTSCDPSMTLENAGVRA